jgi:hypothetical protein
MRDRLEAVSRNAPRPSVRDRYLAYGPNPIRILLTGNGIALGYGVNRRTDTLDGNVGARLAEATRRGVIVNNHTHDSSMLYDQAQAVLAGMNLQSEDIVVWCPSYSEMLERARAGYWRTTMTTFLSQIPSDVSVVLVELPAIVSAEFDSRPLNRIICRINRALRTSARDHRNVTVCSPPPVEFTLARDSLYDANYYDLIGEEVASLTLRQRFGIEYEGRHSSSASTSSTSALGSMLV